MIWDRESKLRALSHLKVNLVSVAQNFIEDIGDVFFLNAILKKDHVGNALKELPEKENDEIEYRRIYSVIT